MDFRCLAHLPGHKRAGRSYRSRGDHPILGRILDFLTVRTAAMLTSRALPTLIRSGYRLYETVPTSLLVAERERDQLRREGHDAVLLIAEPAVAPEPLYFVYWRPGWSASSRKLSAVSRQKATADR